MPSPWGPNPELLQLCVALCQQVVTTAFTTTCVTGFATDVSVAMSSLKPENEKTAQRAVNCSLSIKVSRGLAVGRPGRLWGYHQRTSR